MSDQEFPPIAEDLLRQAIDEEGLEEPLGDLSERTNRALLSIVEFEQFIGEEEQPE